MTSFVAQRLVTVVPQERRRSDVCSIDLQAFCLTARAAHTSDQLRGLMKRTLRAAGVEFFQLATYRRLQFVSVIWSELSLTDDAIDGSQVPRICDSIGCRAMTSDSPERWKPDDRSEHAGWREALRSNGISSGVTSAIHVADDWRYVYHFGARDEQCFGRAGLELFSTLGFITTQRLVMLRSRSDAIAPDTALSARELEVIRWCKDGKSYPEIAQILGISTKTVEFHIANAMRKLGVNQKISAIVEAARVGLIDL